MTDLQIFVTDECWTCEESRRIAAAVEEAFPQVNVELVDLTSSERPDNVFAAPTYMLDGRVISLGNPRWGDLVQQLNLAATNRQAEAKQL